jgi:hypothetical protein
VLQDEHKGRTKAEHNNATEIGTFRSLAPNSSRFSVLVVVIPFGGQLPPLEAALPIVKNRAAGEQGPRGDTPSPRNAVLCAYRLWPERVETISHIAKLRCIRACVDQRAIRNPGVEQS